MYEQHFGLRKRPFRASVAGNDVFVGPQIATSMAGLKKALSGTDAIAVVTGSVGSGKTTLVNRVLESTGENAKVINVARMRLDSDDVLEFLLDELEVDERPSGTIQKFKLFRQRLLELEESGSRVFITVEDGNHLGADTLAELEALTSADAGQSEGAFVVLMGDENFSDMLSEPRLVRLKQRIRKHQTVVPLVAAELRGYLRHCFRLAGRDFEEVFEANAAPLLHHLTDGVPRVSNHLVESAMTAAAEQDLQKVPSELLARIAENEYGLSAKGFDLSQKAPVAPPAVAAPEPVVEPEPVIEAPIVEAPIVEAPVIEAPTEEREAEIPELIQDTLPDLEILAPQLAEMPAPEPEDLPELEPEPETPVVAESSDEEIPAWDRDPTMAELKPDLEALEQALAFTQDDEPKVVVEERQPLPKPPPVVPEVIPEITLDHAISQRIESNLIDEKGEVSAPDSENVAAGDKDVPAIKLPPKTSKKADTEYEKIAEELARAKSLEDVNDRMAETLFGEELSLAASQILANPPLPTSANDDELTDNEAVTGGQAATGSQTPASPPTPTPVPTPIPDVTPDDSAENDVEVTLQAPKELDGGGMDLSASQRLKTVRALNADLHPSIREPESTATPAEVAQPAQPPESIEDQINTSMTQTLKALNVRPPVNDDSMDDDDSKGGFFSRFKRS